MLSTKPGRFSAKISSLSRLGLLGSSHSLQQGQQWVSSGLAILGGARGIERHVCYSYENIAMSAEGTFL